MMGYQAGRRDERAAGEARPNADANPNQDNKNNIKKDGSQNNKR
jgi:hypothetical protein